MKKRPLRMNVKKTMKLRMYFSNRDKEEEEDDDDAFLVFINPMTNEGGFYKYR